MSNFTALKKNWKKWDFQIQSWILMQKRKNSVATIYIQSDGTDLLPEMVLDG